MTTVTRGVDQWLMIGHDIFVGPTDIDPKGVRILARGRMMGGPNDGGTFQAAHELCRGQSFPIGQCITITVLDIRGERVHLGVSAPPHLGVSRKETVQQKLKGNDGG